MSLDLTKVAAQVGDMVLRLRGSRAEKEQNLQRALQVATNEEADLDKLKKKLAASRNRTTWLVADLMDGLSSRYPAPPIPPDFSVIAADGSHIEVDRHRSARCFLINIGSVVLYYGTKPGANLDSVPRLYFSDEDLVVKSPNRAGRNQPIEGNLLGIKRSVEECTGLARLAQELPRGTSALALLDGSLILWGLEAYPDFVKETMLKNGLLKSLGEFQRLSQECRLALASYISFPRSADVVNVLKVALCPHEVVDSDRYCAECKTKECEAVARIHDGDLFMSLLDAGERSSLFVSQSSVLKEYGEHQVCFFYLRTEDEVARVEVPLWVAHDEGSLNLAHALVLDQCRRGMGYPVALSEAHEQAVVTGADREEFWQLVEALSTGEHLPARQSAKSLSKRTRWI